MRFQLKILYGYLKPCMSLLSGSLIFLNSTAGKTLILSNWEKKLFVSTNHRRNLYEFIGYIFFINWLWNITSSSENKKRRAKIIKHAWPVQIFHWKILYIHSNIFMSTTAFILFTNTGSKIKLTFECFYIGSSYSNLFSNVYTVIILRLYTCIRRQHDASADSMMNS